MKRIEKFTDDELKQKLISQAGIFPWEYVSMTYDPYMHEFTVYITNGLTRTVYNTFVEYDND